MALPLELDTTIRDYRLDSVLGQGGMGCVYAATHTRLGRRVAIKVLAPELAANEEYAKRFAAEACIVNGVRHPNIVDIPDIFEEDGQFAYVMEYVDGRPLSSVIKEGPLDVRQAVNITFQLASALEAVHAQGVVHRDLKPDNVMVLGGRDTDMSQVPSVKILDFGIAKNSAESVDFKTVTGSMLGTPTYMAPEQVAASAVSPETDIYALAEMLYEMVSGQRVFHGAKVVDILRMKLAEQPPALSWPQVPGWEVLDRIVQAGLQAHPEDRLNMGALVMGLNEVLAAQPDAPTITPRSGAYPMPPVPTPRPSAPAFAPTSTPAPTASPGPTAGPAFTPPPPAAPATDAHTPVNMQSVVALPTPQSGWRRAAAPLGAVFLLAAIAIGAFAYMESRAPDSYVEALEPPAASAAPLAEAPAPTPVVPAVAPAPPTPPPAAAPVAAPEPEVKKKKKARKKRATKRARRRVRRPAKATVTAKPAAAPKPKPAAKVVKKSELPAW